jgi:predicted PurR-regulated permease PerM
MPEIHSPSVLELPKKVSNVSPPNVPQAVVLFVVIVASLYLGKDVLVPITLALFLAFLLAPLVDLLRKLRLGRVPAVLLGMTAALGVILAIGGVIGTQISELSTNIPEYASTIETKVSTVHNFTIGRLTALANRVGVHPNSSASTKAVPANATAPVPTLLDFAQKYLSSFLSPLGTLGLVLIVAIFALLQQEDLRDRLIRLLGSNDLHRTTLAIDDAGHRLSRYFVTQLSINSVFGVIIGLGLLTIGVPNPVLFGILSGLLRFVPYIGSMISALLPLSLAAAVDPGWSLAIWTGCLYLITEGLTGQFIEPMTYGHSTGLSPFSVIVAAIFWSWLWGPIGLILSTPLTLCLVVIGRHSKKLEFLDIMLGDSPALTPVESLYQRIFAGDADEAQDHAEVTLKEVSLTSYYDAVVTKALQLATGDAQRGALDEEQQQRVRRTINTFIEGLKEHDDKRPTPSKVVDSAVKQPDDEYKISETAVPAGVLSDDSENLSWSTSNAVMCVSGRGPFDESASVILSQLLKKHGLGSQAVPYDAVSREKIAFLDIRDVKIVCISYLDISGSPAHLRYMIQRLRHYLPNGTPILVGLWSAEDTGLNDPKLKANIGADYLNCSFEQAVSFCVDIAIKAGSKTLMIEAAKVP